MPESPESNAVIAVVDDDPSGGVLSSDPANGRSIPAARSDT